LSAGFQDPLADVIRETPVRTVAGLRSKSLVALLDCWPSAARHDGNLSFGDEISHWSLFEAAVNATGLASLLNSINEKLEADAACNEGMVT